MSVSPAVAALPLTVLVLLPELVVRSDISVPYLRPTLEGAGAAC